MDQQLEVKVLSPNGVFNKFKGYLMVRSAEQRVNAKGGRYLDLNLRDRTGEINCKMWDGTVPPPAQGSIVWVAGQVQDFNGRIQMKIDQLKIPGPSEAVPEHLLYPVAPESAEAMRERIRVAVDAFQSEDLRKLVGEMLKMAGKELDYYPAAMRMHHAERGGLLHHTTSMMKLAEGVLECYPYLNRDLLMAGVIIHDLGKIREMDSDSMGNVSDFTRDGLLLGHLVRGVTLVRQAADRTGVSGEWVELLEHMVISHHGQPEYGSPVYPAFPEALALRIIDHFDAMMFEAHAVWDRTPEGAFSEKIPYMDGRRIYHPFYRDETQAE